MPSNDEEIIEDVADVEFDPSLQGKIIDHGNKRSTIIRILIGVVVILLVSGGGWSTYYLTRTNSKDLAERLQKYEVLQKFYQAAAAKINDPTTNQDELKLAVVQLIEVAQTPLKVSQSQNVPEVPEKTLAMLKALEGLLRLQLEGGLDVGTAEGKTFYDEQLIKLGEEKLEYFSENTKTSIPLLQSAWPRKQLQILKESPDAPGRAQDIALLQSQINQISAKESFTIVAPAYLLGKWFNHKHDKLHAEECFQIGRHYIEGYRQGYSFFAGKHPSALTPLWDEYVGCLTSLSQLAMQNQKYRLARSYLVKIFKTPHPSVDEETYYNPSLEAENTAEKLALVNHEITTINRDITITKKAIADPLMLPTFPQFQASHTDQSIDWSHFINMLRQHAFTPSLAPKQLLSPIQGVWQALTPSLRSEILLHKDYSWLTRSTKEEIVEILNNVVQDPAFWQSVTFQPEALSTVGKSLVQKTPAALSRDEIALLNREVLDASLGAALINEYVLEDGTRLSSYLRADQVQLLVNLYEEKLREGPVSSSQRAELRNTIKAIYDGTLHPTLLNLSIELHESQASIEQRIAQTEQVFQTQGKILSAIEEQLQQQIIIGVIDPESLKKLRGAQALAETRRLQARLGRQRADSDLNALNVVVGNLTSDLRQKLANLEARLAESVENQRRLQSKSLRDEDSLLVRLNEQIHLHQNYVTLLERLQHNQGDLTLKELVTQKQKIDSQIESAQQVLATAKGEDKEDAESTYSLLQHKQHQIIQKLTALFEPMHQVVTEIASKEEEIWRAKERLVRTRQEIAGLVGDEASSGTISEKAKQRAELLLMNADGVIDNAQLNEEIATLNDEIAKDQARLSILMQQENQALVILTTFFPSPENVDTLVVKGNLTELHRQLIKQKELVTEYNALWKHFELGQDTQTQETIILENLQLIDNSLKKTERLSEQQTTDIARYMQNIIVARGRVSSNEQLLIHLADVPLVAAAMNKPNGRGIALDTVSLYQMQQQMGLNITDYQQAFAQRDAVVNELTVLIINKNKLEAQRLAAIRNREQIEVDLLTPKILEIENVTNSLAQQTVQINTRLLDLADAYTKQLGKVRVYRKKTALTAASLSKRLDTLDQEIVSTAGKLNTLSAGVFKTLEPLQGVLTQLNISDLTNLPAIIEKERAHLQYLSNIRYLRLQENYYKTQALYFIGKSFYEQGLLNNYENLQTSNALTPEQLADENQTGGILFKEFDASYLYSDEHFGSRQEEKSQEIDQKQASYQAWIDTLETNALLIFNTELLKYATSSTELKHVANYLPGTKQQDIDSYVGRSYLLAGEIYIKRGLRQVRASRTNDTQNVQAIKELNNASKAFLAYLDFAETTTTRTPVLSALIEGSDSFPAPRRAPFNFKDQARIYLGIIATLKKDYQGAIDQYRAILLEESKRLQVVHEDSSKEGGRAIGSPAAGIDPILLPNYEFSPQLYPFFDSILARTPSSHEVLYRIARCYQLLADEEYSQGIIQSAKFQNAANPFFPRFRNYANKAVAYYSQLILTQAYSPYRRASLLQRALASQKLGNYNGSRNDLVAILGDRTHIGGSLDFTAMTAKGDLPGDLDPSYTYVALTLGKVLFEAGEFSAAADAFLMAKESGQQNVDVIQARIAYAESLLQAKDWVKANLFLAQLAKEKEQSPEEESNLYPPTIYIDLGIAKKELGTLNSALEALRECFKSAPPGLVHDGVLNLNNQQALNVLTTEFRDTIHSLALASLYSGDILLIPHNYIAAKGHYARAEQLFRLLPWQEDATLRNLTKKEFDEYKDEYRLKAQWGKLKTDALGLLFDRFAAYRKVVNLSATATPLPSIQELLNSTSTNLELSATDAMIYRQTLDELTSFKELQAKKLPEVIEQQRITALKQLDETKGSEISKKFNALVRIKSDVTPLEKMPATDLITTLITLYGQDTLENKFINNFALTYGSDLILTQQDRKKMIPTNTNLDNLLVVDDASKRLETFNSTFMEWIDQHMRATGFDTAYIPVSPQAGVLEEVDLYRASLLSILDTNSDYEALTTLVSERLESGIQKPSRVSRPEVVWQIVELGAMTAQFRHDWARAVKYNEYLLAPDNISFFELPKHGDLYRARLSLAAALIHLSDQQINELSYISDKTQKESLQETIDKEKSDARNMLMALLKTPDNTTSAALMRIGASDLLEQVH